MSEVVKKPVQGEIMESVIAKGDLAKLTPEERNRYYAEVCHSMGLNPLTEPFSYITLNGKLKLYATRACADQLRKIHGVSLEIVSRKVDDGILTIHARAKTQDGRADEDFGSVAFPDTLKGEARANAELKCVTKAKRRATLSICGLGWLDETEVEDIPASAKRAPVPALVPPHDPQTGEIESDCYITDEQVDEMSKLLMETKTSLGPFLKYIKLDGLTHMRADEFQTNMNLIRETAKKREAAKLKERELYT